MEITYDKIILIQKKKKTYNDMKNITWKIIFFLKLWVKTSVGTVIYDSFETPHIRKIEVINKLNLTNNY